MMLERRVPTSSRRIHGAELVMSTMGGYSVHLDGEYLGYIHAAQGSIWNTYRRVPGEAFDDYLGRFVQDDAVLAILTATGKLTGNQGTEEAA